MTKKLSDNQRAFNKMCRRLADEKGRCGDGWGCKNRLKVNGKWMRCVVGCLMPIKKQEELGVPPEYSVRDKRVREALGECGYKELDFVMAARMQDIHDEPRNWLGGTFIGWEKVVKVANKFGLKTPEPK